MSGRLTKNEVASPMLIFRYAPDHGGFSAPIINKQVVKWME